MKKAKVLPDGKDRKGYCRFCDGSGFADSDDDSCDHCRGTGICDCGICKSYRREITALTKATPKWNVQFLVTTIVKQVIIEAKNYNEALQWAEENADDDGETVKVWRKK